MIFGRFFAKSGTYEAYHMYDKVHWFIVIACAVFILWALYLSRGMDAGEIKKQVRKCAVLLWALEIAKIIFNIYAGNLKYPNSYIPLYFCSIPLYCSIMSGWGRGSLKRAGDVFLTVGGVIGGIAYILTPSTTAGIYPAFHFITVQSFVLHCVMVYLSLLFIQSNYCELVPSDIKYYALTVTFVCICAYTVNYFLDSNLMFVSKNHPGTAVEIVYNMSGKLFPVMMTFWQAIPPFYVVYALAKRYRKRHAREKAV